MYIIENDGKGSHFRQLDDSTPLPLRPDKEQQLPTHQTRHNTLRAFGHR